MSGVNVSCCYQCPRRHVGCQTGCEERAKEIAKHEKEKAARKAFQAQERDVEVSKQAFRKAASR